MSTAPKYRKADYNEGHPATLPIAEDTPLPDPTTFVDPEYFRPDSSVNTEEAEHFKREGFIVKRGLLSGTNAFTEVTDHIWRHVPDETIRPNDTNTWIDPATDQWTESVSLRVGLLARNNWKLRSKGPDGIGTESFLTDQMANHTNMRQVVEALIGGPVQPSHRVRGIYCVFPSAPGTTGRYNVHIDYISSHVAAMIIGSEIAPRGGGFMFWPGSHTVLHPYWQTVHGSGMAVEHSEAFRTAKENILRDTMPIEFTGSPGDVIFWHPRALHSAGINRSAEYNSPTIRIIIPCDFQRAGQSYFDDPDYGPGEEFQWWIDSRNVVEDVPPTEDNMWDDWAI